MENIKFSKNIYVAQSLQKYLRDIHDATQQSENIGRVFFLQMENINFFKKIYIASCLQKYLSDIHIVEQHSEIILEAFCLSRRWKILT